MTTEQLDQTSIRLEKKLMAAMYSDNNGYWFKVRPNVFAIPYLDGFILYSPLQGLSALITRTGLANLLLNEHQSFKQCLGAALVRNRQGSIADDFDNHPFKVPNTEKTNLSPCEQFKPRSLTLSLTSACQLACSYCYINGGDSPTKMPWEIAKASIAFVADSLAGNGASQFDVEFHGQGEPTANWPLFQKAVNEIHTACTARNLTPSLSIVTNGILTEEKIKFIADNRIRVGLSLDGLKQSTDSQRPLRRLGSSFDRITESIDLFRKHGVDIGIRSTVTSLNLPEMTAFTEYLSERQVQFVNFEPVCYTGRALRHDQLSETIIPAFIQEFRKARDVGILNGVSVAYSAARTDGIRSNFCGAYGKNLNFCVSTEGLVSSCYEVLNSDDQRASLFIYGQFDRATNRFVFDNSVLARLIGLSVSEMKRCDNCYAKWNCGGDCISKISKDGLDRIMDDSPIDRCMANREITKDDLFRIFLTEEKEVSASTSVSTAT